VLAQIALGCPYIPALSDSLDMACSFTHIDNLRHIITKDRSDFLCPSARAREGYKKRRRIEWYEPIVVHVSSTVSCNTAACNTRTSVIPVAVRKLATAIGWLILSISLNHDRARTGLLRCLIEILSPLARVFLYSQPLLARCLSASRPRIKLTTKQILPT